MTDASTDLTAETFVSFLADIFARRGGEEYLGESVTMAEHMLQGAAIAEERGFPDTIVVAALLHDIGHFTSEFGTFRMDDTEDRFHEIAGAEVLAPFLPPEVVDCVRWQVAAKRYLCATQPAYRRKLSEASLHSLNLQGGPMSADEAAAFARQPHLDAIIKVRHLDDAGKMAGMETPGFDHFAPLVQRLVEAHTASQTERPD